MAVHRIFFRGEDTEKTDRLITENKLTIQPSKSPSCRPLCVADGATGHGRDSILGAIFPREVSMPQQFRIILPKIKSKRGLMALLKLYAAAVHDDDLVPEDSLVEVPAETVVYL